MSKAVLVLDMPQNCRLCDFINYYDSNGEYYCGMSYDYLVIDDMDIESRFPIPKCPLKDLPKKKKVSKYMNEKERRYFEGWNACIDAINTENRRADNE